MSKKTCTKCHCNCHCGEPLHSHHYDKDLCTCDNCECSEKKAEDLTYENNVRVANNMIFNLGDNNEINGKNFIYYRENIQEAVLINLEYQNKIYTQPTKEN